MQSFSTINPATEEVLKEYTYFDENTISSILSKSTIAFEKWKMTTLESRCQLFNQLASELQKQKETLAVLMTEEMGKPILQSRAEVDKCVTLCEYYIENAPQFLQSETIASDAQESYVQYDPIGTVLGIMPWNFPLWQVLRFAVPAVIAGNCAILKHSPNVSGTALFIEELFSNAGFPEDVFRTILAHTDSIPNMIASDIIASVSVTASEQTGSAVGEIAGKNITKSVLELGGNDAFIVLPDADLDDAASIACASRNFNSGQTCISAKRFYVHNSILEAFTQKFVENTKALQIGDPTNESTNVGPLARPDLVGNLQRQVDESIKMGAKVLYTTPNIPSKGNFFAPTVLGEITEEMPVFSEETFGPVTAISSFETEEEVVQLTNNSRYGLAATIYTNDRAQAQKLASKLNVGHVAINGMVKSDPRLPFGGVKKSGYGNELSKLGILEFVNAKTIWVG